MELDQDLQSIQEVRNLVASAKRAAAALAEFSQEQLDHIVAEIAAACEQNNERLARMACEETGFGNWQDKMLKNQLGSTLTYQSVKNMKTVGLLALMAQSGLQIPAAYGSELPVFDEVFADIGDEQSIEQSLSTFSSHMTNIVAILQAVTPRSLALFDELGAGTDPTEGAALAMAILEHLLSMKTTTLATTHYSELKAFALSTPGVENASVEFDVETLRPTYRLSIGVPGKSNAFEISRKLGLPDFLIEKASQHLTRDQIRFEDVIAGAEYHRQIAEKERRLVEEAHQETQKLRDEAERLQKQLESRRETEIKKAKEDARRILQKAQRDAEQVISELKRKSAATVKEHELHNLRAQLQDALDANAETIQPAKADEGGAPADIRPGDSLMLLTLNTRGEALTAPDNKGELTVQAGALKLKVNVRDVRGMTLEEAILAVDMFLDGATLNRLKMVYIIHGKGTGVLRAGIQKHLKKHPAVSEFRLGRYGEGEDGVTVVTLK